ncbi:MAG: NAD(+) diphosphatase [Anaeromyxobacter sp.]
MLLPDSFTPCWSPPAAATDGLWFVFQDGKLVVSNGEAPGLPPPGAAPVPVEGIRCFGTLGDVPCWAAQAREPALPEGLSAAPLRALFDRLADGPLALAGRAAQVLEFERTHRFCGACGAPTESGDGDCARRCPACQAVFYPRLAPAMMALVTRQGPSGRELLLARGRRFGAPIHSALAGFVEPSETLEECVRREVREEVGLEVRNLRYFGSQCWPFPHSLMVAFLAEHAGGEIRCDEEEIVEAAWHPVDRLPNLPHRLSVARKPIDFAVAEAGGASSSPPTP